MVFEERVAKLGKAKHVKMYPITSKKLSVIFSDKISSEKLLDLSHEKYTLSESQKSYGFEEGIRINNTTVAGLKNNMVCLASDEE